MEQNRKYTDSSDEETIDTTSPEDRRTTRTRTRRSSSDSRWSRERVDRRLSSISRLRGKAEKDRRYKIERENQILLQKILDCHHGHDRERTSGIPRSGGQRKAGGLAEEGAGHAGGKPGEGCWGVGQVL